MIKWQKCQNYEEILKRQNAELDNLIRDLRCEDHIVKNPKNGQWFFRVDNTKSGQTENSERCKEVTAITSILDSSSKHYWSKKNEERPIPVAWVRFELYLVSWKLCKIMNVQTATDLARRVGIKSDEEALMALKFLHNLGVIFYFWDVSELANCVIIDPTWLISTVAAFVTAKEPRKVMHQRRWRKLCETGKFSRDMVMSLLTEAKVESRDQEPVLDVLRMLDILCDPPEASSSEFFIPCMLSPLRLPGPSKWTNYCPSEAFPPPIVIYPIDVQRIPEAFFFRIVTKYTRNFSDGCEFSRSCCRFRIGNNLVLELLFYCSGACLIVTMNGEGDKEKATSSVPKRAPEIEELLIKSITSAKRRGMQGLKLVRYYQVSSCIRSTEDDSYRPPDGDGLVEWSNSCTPGYTNPVIIYKNPKECISDTHLKLVHRWYKKMVRPTVFSLINLLKVFRMSHLLNRKICTVMN